MNRPTRTRPDRETIIRNFLTAQYGDALRVIAFNAAEGWSWDVSEDIALEVLERAFDADDNLCEDTKRFIDRHVSDPTNRAGRVAASSAPAVELSVFAAVPAPARPHAVPKPTAARRWSRLSRRFSG
jgi:hypothetical protein